MSQLLGTPLETLQRWRRDARSMEDVLLFYNYKKAKRAIVERMFDGDNGDYLAHLRVLQYEMHHRGYPI